MSREIVLVTGGTGGIGRAVVERLVADGRSVAFTWRTAGDTAAEIESAAEGLARGYELDLADRQRPAELVREIEQEAGPIVGLVNNAGMEQSGLLAMTSDAAWDRLLDVNLGGAFRCCRAVVPRMVRRRAGSIVNVGSLAARKGVAGLAAYAAAKAGLEALGRCLAREVGSRNLRVNTVAAGFVATGMTEDLPQGAAANLRATECLPSGVTPAEVAATIAFLLSEEAASITGQTVVIDAGASA